MSEAERRYYDAIKARLKKYGLEPLLDPVAILADAYEMPLGDAPSWVVAGAAKGHRTTERELFAYRAIRDNCAMDGVPFWQKSPLTLDGHEHRELPEGWPCD